MEDSPSRMRYAPLSTRAGHSGEPAGSRAQDEDAGGGGGLGHESDGLEEERPAALIVGEDGESGEGGGVESRGSGAGTRPHFERRGRGPGAGRRGCV